MDHCVQSFVGLSSQLFYTAYRINKGFDTLVAFISFHFFEPVEKLRFSACGVEAFDRRLADAGCSTWVVCGIETHVCVNQTVHDLIARGHTVHVAADAVSSRVMTSAAAQTLARAISQAFDTTLAAHRPTRPDAARVRPRRPGRRKNR